MALLDYVASLLLLSGAATVMTYPHLSLGVTFTLLAVLWSPFGMRLISNAAARIIGMSMDDNKLRHMWAEAIVDAANNVMGEDRIRNAWNEVIKKSVSEVITDEAFIGCIKDMIRDSLQDASLFRAGASGMFEALNPFKGRPADQLPPSSPPSASEPPAFGWDAPRRRLPHSEQDLPPTPS